MLFGDLCIMGKLVCWLHAPRCFKSTKVEFGKRQLFAGRSEWPDWALYIHLDDFLKHVRQFLAQIAHILGNFFMTLVDFLLMPSDRPVWGKLCKNWNCILPLSLERESFWKVFVKDFQPLKTAFVWAQNLEQVSIYFLGKCVGVGWA